MKKLYFTLLILIFSHLKISAQSNVELVGDFLAGALPAIPLIMDMDQYYQGNKTPFVIDASAYASSMATTYILKGVINRERPNGEDYSFPSGHATSAFSGATMIYLDYGKKYAIPAYALASFVAYSRVYANKHFVSDVITGAIVGSGITYLVHRYARKKNWSFAAQWEKNSKSVALVYKF